MDSRSLLACSEWRIIADHRGYGGGNVEGGFSHHCWLAAGIRRCRGSNGSIQLQEGRRASHLQYKAPPPGWSCRAIIVNDPRWIEIAETADGDPVQVDSKTISRSPGITTAWIQQWGVHLIARTGQGTLQRVVSRIEFDCAKRTAKLLMSVEYALGNSNGTSSAPLRPAALPVVPGTVQEIELDTLCSKR